MKNPPDANQWVFPDYLKEVSVPTDTSSIDASLDDVKHPENRASRRDRNRRRRFLDAVAKSIQHQRVWIDGKQKRLVPRGAQNAAHALAARSDDYCSTVWGAQEGIANEAGCSQRQFQRDLKELERHGLIVVERCAPEQRADGKWTRPRTNRYKFCVPPARPKRKPRSRRHDADVASNQQTTFVHKPLRDSHVNSFSLISVAKFLAGKHQCDQCDAGWILGMDGIATRCQGVKP